MLKGLLGFFAFIFFLIVLILLLVGSYLYRTYRKIRVAAQRAAERQAHQHREETGVNASSTASANSMAQPIKLVIRKTPVLMSSPAQRRQPLVRPS